MTVVKEYVTSKGAVIRFHDGAYQERSEEERRAAFENLNRVASRCLLNERTVELDREEIK